MKNLTVTLTSLATRCAGSCKRLRQSLAFAAAAAMLLGSGIAWATPPVVTMTSPTSTGYYVAPANITVTVSASDIDSTVTHVTFYDEFGQIADITNDGSGIYSHTFPNVAAASHTLTARAYNSNGESALSAAVPYTIFPPPPATPPTVTLTNSATSNVAPATVSLTAVATGGGTVTSISMYGNGVLWGGYSASNGVLNVNFGNLAAGTYNFRAAANMSGGGTAVSSILTITVVPNTPPTVSMTGPPNGSTYVAPASVRLLATASDTDGTISYVNFINNGGAENGSGWDGSLNSYRADWGNLAAGTYHITAKAYDNGNATTISAPITFTVVPNTPPTVTITGPANGSIYVAPASVHLFATASDTDGTVSYVNFISNGGAENGSGWDSSVNMYRADWGNLPVGTYHITAKAYDNGNATTISAPITFTVYPSKPPIVSITAPANNTTFPTGAAIPLHVNAGDIDGTISQVQLFSGATAIGTATLASGNASSGAYVYNWTGAPAGTYTVTAVATDNSTAAFTSAPITVTVSAGAVSSVSVTSPTAGSTYAAPANVPLAATAVNAAYGISQVEFFSGGTPIGLGTLTSGTATSGSWVTNAWTNVAAGSYTVTAKATDESGYTTISSPVTFTVGAASSGASVGLYFVGTDHLGTPRLVEDQLQQPVWKWAQGEVFGDSVPDQQPGSGGAFVFNQRFPGQYFDHETNTSYNYYRDYDPALGRYEKSDLIGLQGGINTYVYATNDPLAVVDPFGLMGQGAQRVKPCETCKTTFRECLEKCYNALNPFPMTPITTAAGVWSVVTTTIVRKGAAAVVIGTAGAAAASWASGVFTGWALGTLGGCSLMCSIGACYYD